MEDFLVITLGCLPSQLSVGFKFDQLHQIFNDHIALEFFAFLFGKQTLTLSMDEFVCSFSYLGRGMESHDLFRSGMIREKVCNFSSGLCFEKHNDFLLLKRIAWFVLDDPPRAYHRRGCVAKTR
jgi:hypothetical protein